MILGMRIKMGREYKELFVHSWLIIVKRQTDNMKQKSFGVKSGLKIPYKIWCSKRISKPEHISIFPAGEG